MESISFTLGNVEYSVPKLGLRKWLELEELHSSIQDYMRDGNTVEVTNSIYSCLSLILDVDRKDFDEMFWMEVSNAYLSILLACIPRKEFPILRSSETIKDEQVWDYKGRTWYSWSHLIAQNYGWGLQYISDLDYEDGIAYIQEILLNEQLGKEWEWQLSEIAYPYNSTTKKSEFKPLSRPSWMMQINKPKPIQNVKMPVDLIPAGVILKWEQNEEVVN